MPEVLTSLPPSIAALLGFIALTLALVMTVVFYRIALVFTFKTPANSWTRGDQKWSDPPIITRMTHAHLNCLETVPLFAGLVLVAAFTGNLNITDPLACWFLLIRGAQVTVHTIGVNAALVFIRANMIVLQWAIMVWWLLNLSGLISG